MSKPKDTELVGSWIRRFLLEYLVGERNLSLNTQQSYRDTLRQLLPFVASKRRCPVDRLMVEDLSADRIRQFLAHVEQQRGCSTSTRNQRLAALLSFVSFVATHSPQHVEWSSRVHGVPFKRCRRQPVTYLEKHEIDALLAAPNGAIEIGRRDHTLLLFLYNTGARAAEAAAVTIGDLDLPRRPEGTASVRILGKGNKVRRCPLWAQTARELVPLIAGRSGDEPVFINRRGQSLTRFGIHTMVERYARIVAEQLPAMRKKRVSPHTIRHTTATHLLRAGVDINTIRAWLGHVSVDTTNIYAEVDLQMKADALTKCALPSAPRRRKAWREDTNLMAFLASL
jgi:integrase/recombinase XerD